MGAAYDFSMLIAVIAAGQIATPETPTFTFWNSYTVRAQGNDGSCLYIVGDVYIQQSKLSEILKTEKHKELGVEFLTTNATPSKCETHFSKAAAKAGFINYRTRLRPERDR